MARKKDKGNLFAGMILIMGIIAFGFAIRNTMVVGVGKQTLGMSIIGVMGLLGMIYGIFKITMQR